jgi:hypothetical protein
MSLLFTYEFTVQTWHKIYTQFVHSLHFIKYCKPSVNWVFEPPTTTQTWNGPWHISATNHLFETILMIGLIAICNCQIVLFCIAYCSFALICRMLKTWFMTPISAHHKPKCIGLISANAGASCTMEWVKPSGHFWAWLVYPDLCWGLCKMNTPIHPKSGPLKTACSDLPSGPQCLCRAGKHMVKSDWHNLLLIGWECSIFLPCKPCILVWAEFTHEFTYELRCTHNLFWFAHGLDLVYPQFVLALLKPCRGSASHALGVHILGPQAQKQMLTMAY